jgi:glucan biosynthesis protein C
MGVEAYTRLFIPRSRGCRTIATEDGRAPRGAEIRLCEGAGWGRLRRVSPASPARLPWVDHLRTAMIVLVVNMHACVTYSHVGDWYMMSKIEPTMEAKVPFIVWQGMLQSFFMGLLFFLAGYFSAGSVARRGPGDFVRERLVRLGLPALLYMLAIHPFILLVLNPWNYPFGPAGKFYGNYLASGKFLGSSGPLWFAVALLIFCVVLAAWALVRPLAAGGEERMGKAPAPSGRVLLAVGIGLGLGTFAVRLVQPIGTNVLNLQLCFFVQYIAWFVAGLHAARHGWLEPLAASRQAKIAGWVALVGGPVAMLALLFFGARDNGVPLFVGGPHWQALGLAVWEQVTGLGLALGALALFARRANRESPVLRWLGERSFGVYVLHAPVLVALAMWFRGLPHSLYGLVALLTVAGLVVSYALADVARRVPGLRAIL